MERWSRAAGVQTWRIEVWSSLEVRCRRVDVEEWSSGVLKVHCRRADGGMDVWRSGGVLAASVQASRYRVVSL